MFYFNVEALIEPFMGSDNALDQQKGIQIVGSLLVCNEPNIVQSVYNKFPDLIN